MRNVGTAMLALGFVGCSSLEMWEVRQPKVPGAGAQSAVLVNPGDSHIWIQAVDGERLGLPAHGRYRLPPGRHSVKAVYFWTQGYVVWNGNEPVEYAFDAKADSSLQVVCEHQETTHYKGTWKFWIEDAASHAVVAPEDAGALMAREATGVPSEPFFLRRFHAPRGM